MKWMEIGSIIFHQPGQVEKEWKNKNCEKTF